MCDQNMTQNRTIKVTICTGTTCYLMGASFIQSLSECLDDKMMQQVEIFGATCMGLCKNNRYGQAPYVRVNDQVISEASVQKVIDCIAAIIVVEEEL